jgi:Holliday junction DNA helicase RuvB
MRNLDFYGVDDLVRITHRSAVLLEVPIDAEGARSLAQRSRGTPRIVNRLLKRVRDYAQVRSDGRIDRAIVDAGLALEGVDGLGLTRLDRRYLKTIIDYYGGGPAGIEAIAATLQEDADTLVDVVEPYLLAIGMVTRTSSGRRASPEAFRHLGLKAQGRLF